MLLRFGLIIIFISLASCAASPDLATIAEWRTKADKSYQAGEYQVALKQYEKLTEVAPSDADVWFRLGNTYSRMDRTQEAVKAYREAVLRDPHFAKAWYNAGFNQLRASAQTFSEALKYLPPDDPIFRIAKTYNEQLLQLMEKQNNELAKMSEKPKGEVKVDVSKVEMIVLDGKPQKISDLPPALLPDQTLPSDVVDPQEPTTRMEITEKSAVKAPQKDEKKERFWHPPLIKRAISSSENTPNDGEQQ
jgi:tetratricopeptide (TPR) repeat protein